MNALITLFPFAMLVFIIFWMFFPINISKIKAWFRKTWTKERIIDFFFNWTEIINENQEIY